MPGAFSALPDSVAEKAFVVDASAAEVRVELVFPGEPGLSH